MNDHTQNPPTEAGAAGKPHGSEYPAPRPSVVHTSAGPAYVRPDLIAFILPGAGQHIGMTQVVTVQGAVAILGAQADRVAEELWPGITGTTNPLARIGPRSPGGGVILGTDGRAA